MIHPSAIVDETAQVSEGVRVGPFTIIEEGVVVGKECEIDAHVVIRKGCEIGDNVSIDSFSVIGGNPQDLSFEKSSNTGVRVGANTVIREGVTIHRSTVEGSCTEIGGDCFLMAYSHVAHDCKLEEGVILANNALLGGHVHIGKNVFIGGSAVFHQFVRIGEGAMVGGNASISMDVPPQVICTERNVVYGLNLVGLKRRGADKETISDLKKCLHHVFQFPGNPKKLASEALESDDLGNSSLGRSYLEFFENGKRGFARPEVKS